MTPALFPLTRTVLLFDEDFDRPPPMLPAPEPEIIEPVFTAAEMEAVRANAFRDGHDAAAAEALAADTARVAEALAQVAALMAGATARADAIAGDAAEALAGLLFAAFAAAFPALCAAHGADEVKAVVQLLLPALHHETRVTLRAEPRVARLLEAEITAAGPELSQAIQITPVATLGPGDLHITWRGGGATRDTAALWREIEAVLAPAGARNNEAKREHPHVE